MPMEWFIFQRGGCRKGTGGRWEEDVSGSQRVRWKQKLSTALGRKHARWEGYMRGNQAAIKGVHVWKYTTQSRWPTQTINRVVGHEVA